MSYTLSVLQIYLKMIASMPGRIRRSEDFWGRKTVLGILEEHNVSISIVGVDHKASKIEVKFNWDCIRNGPDSLELGIPFEVLGIIIEEEEEA